MMVVVLGLVIVMVDYPLPTNTIQQLPELKLILKGDYLHVYYFSLLSILKLKNGIKITVFLLNMANGNARNLRMKNNNFNK